jgi:integrase
MNDITLNKRKIHKFIPPDEASHEDRAYTVDEIQKILDQCDERSKVIFLLKASTGMRIEALDGLKIGHLEKIDAYHLYKIQVYANDSYPHSRDIRVIRISSDATSHGDLFDAFSLSLQFWH